MSADFHEIVAPLLAWYEKNARELPWREDHSPYRVWVSEIMLQQTRVEAVKPYFERFVRELPDLASLAAAPEDRLLKLWEGLGYYSRVRNLQKAARQVMENYGGHFPEEARELETLPGIGEYTAGAVASIAFGKPEPAVDGNVLRVLARWTSDGRDIGEPGVKREYREALRAVYPEGQAGSFTQALMELGAMVCLPNGAPMCGECPLAPGCLALRGGDPEAFPIKKAPAKRKTERRTVFLILNGGRAALRRRPESGLLAGLWEFPNVLGKLSADEAKGVLKEWGITAERLEKAPPAKHVFSHLEWHMTGYLVLASNRPEKFEWAENRELERRYALPAALKTYRDFLQARSEYGTIETFK